MQTINLIFTAGQEITHAVAGRYVRLLSASAVVKVAADGGSFFDLELGIGVEMARQFSTLRIVSATAQTVMLAVADVRVDDNRLVGNVDITGGLDTREVLPTTLSNAAVTVGTSAVVVAASNINRRSALIVNSGAAVVYVGGLGVTTANGIPVPALGGAIDLSATAAIYAISGSAGNDVRVLQEVA